MPFMQKFQMRNDQRKYVHDFLDTLEFENENEEDEK